MSNQRIMHDMDLAKVGQILDARIQNVTTAEKNALAGTLGTGNTGLFVFDTDEETLNIWDGSTFRTISPDVSGDVIFKGLINPSNVASIASDPDHASGHQYIVDAAGTLSATGVTFTPTATVEVGDMVLWTSTTEASVINKNFNEATETEAGTVQLAAQLDVDTGTDTERVITPATLAGSTLASDVATAGTDIDNLELFVGRDSSGAINSLADNLTATNLIDAINELNSNFLQDSDEVAANDADLAALDSDLTAASLRLDGLDADIVALKSIDDSANARLDSADLRFVAVESRLSGHDSNIQALYDADSDFGVRFDLKDASFDGLVDRVDEVERRLDSADLRFVEVETRLNDDSDIISNLQDEDSDLSDKLNSLENRLDSAESRLDSHDSDISDLQDVDSDIKAFVGFSETLNTTATTLVDAINELHGEINANDSDIAALDSRIVDLESRDNVASFTGTTSLTANTPQTVNHAMSLTDPNDFVIHVMNSVGSAIEFDVDAVDSDNITLTSDVSLTNVQVFMLGNVGAGTSGGGGSTPTTPAGALMLQDLSGYLITEDGDAITIQNP